MPRELPAILPPEIIPSPHLAPLSGYARCLCLQGPMQGAGCLPGSCSSIDMRCRESLAQMADPCAGPWQCKVAGFPNRRWSLRLSWLHYD